MAASRHCSRTYTRTWPGPGGGLELVARTRQTVDLDSRGLLLVPSLFAWPTPSVQHDGRWRPTLMYPARGVGRLWTRQSRSAAALTALLGRSRAAILSELEKPTSTSALVRQLALSPATVSGHLKVMHRAELLTTAHRAGHNVRYERTRLGDAVSTCIGSGPPANCRTVRPPPHRAADLFSTTEWVQPSVMSLSGPRP